MLQPKKKPVTKVANTVAKAGGASAFALALSKIPGAETVYDIGNVLQGIKQGDPIKIGTNTVGALIPGVSGKAFEAITEDWIPPTPKKQIDKNKKVLQGKRATPEEMRRIQNNSGFSEGMEVLKKDVTDFFSNLLAYGTSNQGIMKKGMNPRKKYANGTNTQGVGPNNYIQTPNEVLNDYNIMLAKADLEAANNKLVPIVSMVGGLMQQGLSMLGGKAGAVTPTDSVIDTEAINSFDFTKGSQGATLGVGQVAAMGMNSVEGDVEVEGGEMYETPEGQVGEFKGPSHEEGGIPLEVGQDVEEGTKVYSDRLKVGKETLAERKGKREKQIANLEKIASQPLIDTAVKNAAKRKMKAIQKEEAADLQFQEQINNMQQMADNVVKAFGTGVMGVQDSMKYEGGTGPEGIVYGKGYNADMFKDFYAKYNQLNPGGVMNMNYIQGDLGIESNTPGFGKMFGPSTYKASQDWLAANKDKMPDTYVTGDTVTPVAEMDYTPTGFAEGFGVDSQGYTGDEYVGDPVTIAAQEDMNFYTPGGVGTPIDNPEGTVFSRTANKVGKAIGKGVQKVAGMSGELPGMGDLVGMFGNYLGATSGLKNAAEQRSTDITHRNVYANAGKESQKQLDNAMGAIENSKAQAIVKATTTTQGGKRSGRNSARGINQKRGMDWLYDTALGEQLNTISTNAASQVAEIYKAKSAVSLNADQMKGQGEYQANMANEASKDAYSTAKGLGLRDQALGVQNIGKDLNAMKQNKMIENLMKEYGKYVSVDKKGNVANKNKTKASNTGNIEVPDGKGGTISMTKEQFEQLMNTINNK